MQISSNLHSNVSRSTRINSSSVHTYIFVCFTLRVILQGFVTRNATQTWSMRSIYQFISCDMFYQICRQMHAGHNTMYSPVGILPYLSTTSWLVGFSLVLRMIPNDVLFSFSTHVTFSYLGVSLSELLEPE